MSSSWKHKYIELAKHISTWSKDPSTRVGAVAVGKHGQILSQGYNGIPRGVHDTSERLNIKETKYKFVVHAEQNCIYNATLNGVSLNGADLYVYGLPVCSECAKGVVQVGIKRVFMCHPFDISSTWSDSHELSKLMFTEVGIEFEDVKIDE